MNTTFLSAAAAATIAITASAADAITLKAIDAGDAPKLFTTEVKRDQNVSGSESPRGDDVFLRIAGDFSQTTSAGNRWGAAGTSYDWSLSYDGDLASLTVDGIGNVENVDIDPDGTWNAFKFFVKADDAARFETATTTVTLSAVNGTALGSNLVVSATDGGTEGTWSLSDNATITSLSGTLVFDFDLLDGATGSPNSRLQFSVKAYEVAPVPLPAGLPLMLAGVGAFAYLRRRAKV